MYIKLIAVIIVVVLIAAAAIITFMNLPSEKRKENVKEWLKWAVITAEQALGSGTGQLKLRMVYGMAVEKFPWVASFISFEVFSSWVDEALEWMNKQLDNNKAVKEYINN